MKLSEVRKRFLKEPEEDRDDDFYGGSLDAHWSDWIPSEKAAPFDPTCGVCGSDQVRVFSADQYDDLETGKSSVTILATCNNCNVTVTYELDGKGGLSLKDGRIKSDEPE